jgi:mono/diheme cytochrome c family protein
MKSSNNPYATAKKLLVVTMITVPLVSAAMWCSAQQHTPWVTPKAAQDVKNPFAGDKSALADGKTLYVNNCAPCHGAKGRGDGPAAAALNPKPADHSSGVVQSESDGSLFWKLSEGRNPMPSYKKILTDKQRWELVNYIRTLARTPVAK